MEDMEGQQPREASAPAEDTITQALHTLPIRKAADFTMIYANNAHFATSPWDLTLIFGQAVTVDPQDLHLEQRVAVTLSPQTAKAIAEFLVRNVAAYEQQYGEIHYTPIQPQTEEPSV